MSSGIIDAIKQACVNGIDASKPVELYMGTILSTDPIKVKLSEVLTLGNKQVSVNGEVNKDDLVMVVRQQGGQKYIVLGNTTNIIENITYNVIYHAEGGNKISGFRWPLKVKGRLSSPFGFRIHPITHRRKMHTGIDLAVPAGTPVVASKAGTVRLTQSIKTGYGKNIIVDHEDGFSTRYAHLKTINCKQGQKVSQGQQIGTVNSTGSSTGNHLHFEVRKFNAHLNPLNFTNDSKR